MHVGVMAADAMSDMAAFLLPQDPLADASCNVLRGMFTDAKRQILQTSQYVAVGGAGMHGLMYIGALMSLCNNDRDTYAAWYAGVKGLAGSSAGAIITFMILCGLDPWQMRREVVLCNLGRVVENVSDTSMEEMRKMGALTSGKAADDATRELVARNTGDAETTFKQLQVRTSRTFIVAVSNVDSGRTEYWSHWSKPDMPVWLALRCTSSVPVIFSAHRVLGSCIYDGGISCNIPCHVFPSHATLTLFNYSHYEKSLKPSKMSEISNLAKMTWMNQQLGAMRAMPLYAAKSVPCVARPKAVSAYAYNAGLTDIDVLIEDGMAAVHGVLLRNLLVAIVYAMAVATGRWRVLAKP